MIAILGTDFDLKEALDTALAPKDLFVAKTLTSELSPARDAGSGQDWTADPL
jgi:hypothetical protein